MIDYALVLLFFSYYWLSWVEPTLTGLQRCRW